jgi:hypothetical protein
LPAGDSIAATLMMNLATTWLTDTLVLYIEPPGFADAIGIFFLLFGIFASFTLATALLKRAPRSCWSRRFRGSRSPAMPN